jgi:hypothetical protein
MKRLLTITFFCLIPITSICQNHQFALETGYNRIGVFLNPHLGLDFSNHQIHLGIKAYGYNLFFESNNFGPQLGYQYQFNTNNDKIFFYPSLSFSAYREQKINANLLLSELNLKYAFGINITPKFAIINEVGMGYILSNANLFNELKTIKSAYPSFEISFGLVYQLTNSTK